MFVFLSGQQRTSIITQNFERAISQDCMNKKQVGVQIQSFREHLICDYEVSAEATPVQGVQNRSAAVVVLRMMVDGNLYQPRRQPLDQLQAIGVRRARLQSVLKMGRTSVLYADTDSSVKDRLIRYSKRLALDAASLQWMEGEKELSMRASKPLTKLATYIEFPGIPVRGGVRRIAIQMHLLDLMGLIDGVTILPVRIVNVYCYIKAIEYVPYNCTYALIKDMQNLWQRATGKHI